MRSRSTALAAFVIASLAVVFALVPVRAEQIHRHGFNGKQTALVRGDANVRVDEIEHDISTLKFKSQPSSEHLKLNVEAATGDSAFIYYYYDTPPAPITELLTAGIWVNATRGGIQLRARIVFPNEPDPDNPQIPLTTLVVGKTYEKTRNWEKLTLDDAPELLNKCLPLVQTRIKRAVNAADAYIDRLVLNLYAGPGSVEVWVDDLDIGPVKSSDEAIGAISSVPVARTKNINPAIGAHGRQVEERGGELFVDGKPFLFQAIRYTGTPLFVLRQAGFNSLWVPPEATTQLLDEATREGWMVIPSVPVAASAAQDEAALNRDADALALALRKFGGVDVLFWDMSDLQKGRTADQADHLYKTNSVIRSQDPRHPRGALVKNGFQAYSNYLDVVGSYRWPLFTSLGMNAYREWLSERRTLTASRATYWTWIQNHLPDWYISTVLNQKPTDPFTDPIGPHPEQVRLMAYIALATGCRGLGFWSDRYLADSHQGRDRLQGMALLNSEIAMLSPSLMAVRQPTQWLPTSEHNVKAALLQGERGMVLLPMWLGPNSQFVPDQASVPALQITVPIVSDGADPWRISPAGIECLANQCKKGVAGTEITIQEFDTVCPIVFTNDRAKLVVWWQDYVRLYGRLAARWALDMAAVEYEKVYATYSKLKAMGVQRPEAERLFIQAANFHEDARRNFAAELYSKSYLGAIRAMRPLRVIMADQWREATRTLDVPTASPYAVSYFSLPKHYELMQELRKRQAGPNLLQYGSFNVSEHIPESGLPVNYLPGWTTRCGTLEHVDVKAVIVGTKRLEEKVEERKPPKPVKGIWSPGREIPFEPYKRPTPELGNGALKLEVKAIEELDKDGKPKEAMQPPLETTCVVVDSPMVQLPPETLVRVSFWVKIPKEIQATADGLLVYDNAGEEPLSVRLVGPTEWKQYHLYRKVPSSGKIGVTIVLTGIGVAYIENVMIEPLVPIEGGASPIAPDGVQTASLRQR